MPCLSYVSCTDNHSDPPASEPMSQALQPRYMLIMPQQSHQLALS